MIQLNTVLKALYARQTAALAQDRRQARKSLHKACTNLLFHKLRRDGPPALALLGREQTACIEDLDSSTRLITLTDSVSLDVERPVRIGDAWVLPDHATEDALWVADTSPFQIGQQVTQTILDCHASDSVAKLVEYWKGFWCRPALIDEAGWQRVLSCLPQAPVLPCEVCAPITGD